MSELKPCPFCGWGTIVDGGFLNHKCTCNACGASTKAYPTWELAVEAWNRRLRMNESISRDHENDLISRQKAIDKINERQRELIYCFGFDNDMVKIMDIAKSIVTAMPSAQSMDVIDEVDNGRDKE